MNEQREPISFPRYRVDRLAGNATIIAPARTQRPHSHESDAGFDPFLEGNESETPPEILAIRNNGSLPDGPGWLVRVVPNRFPAVVESTEMQGDQSPYDQPATGTHDVIVECPQFESCMSELPAVHVRHIFEIYQQRLSQLSRLDHLSAAVLFKNRGAAAGASLAHAHSQIIGTEFVPRVILDELKQCEALFETTGKDPFDEFLERSFPVAESADVVAVCPKSSRFPWEVHIVPKTAVCRFEEARLELIAQTADLMKSVLQRLNTIHPELPYNFALHSLPFRNQPITWYRWHFEIYPRLAGIAGYEIGAGCFINPVNPDAAAKRLRDIVIE